jgi:hypothetical protein
MLLRSRPSNPYLFYLTPLIVANLLKHILNKEFRITSVGGDILFFNALHVWLCNPSFTGGIVNCNPRLLVHFLACSSIGTKVPLKTCYINI